MKQRAQRIRVVAAAELTRTGRWGCKFQWPLDGACSRRCRQRQRHWLTRQVAEFWLVIRSGCVIFPLPQLEEEVVDFYEAYPFEYNLNCLHEQGFQHLSWDAKCEERSWDQKVRKPGQQQMVGVSRGLQQYHTQTREQAKLRMKLVESFLGFKEKKSIILEQRNSILKLLLFINIPSIILIVLFNKYVPDVYMDEYFHYRQFLHYYNNQFGVWDSKITTPPGLYYLQKLCSFLTGSSLGSVRALNSLVFGNLFLVFAMKIYEFNDHNINNMTRSLNLALTPTIFFFNFLDYTDSASLTFVTLAYYYCIVGSSWRMGVCSLIAVYVRQNNIIWCLYLLVYKILSVYASSISSIRGNIFRCVISFVKLMLVNFKNILVANYVQICIFPIFAFYLYRYNQGRLVFGDHSNHEITIHPTQFLYLTIFITINLPITFNDFIFAFKQSVNRLYFSRHALAAYLFLVAASIVIVDKFTIVHPFILADNRHYVFYIYRYFKWSQYPMCLVYPFCFISVLRLIVNNNDKLVKFILWCVASMLYLMVSPLVELRYFTVPFVLLAFEIRNRSLTFDVERIHKREIKDERWVHRMIYPTLIKIALNIAVFYVFLFRNFGPDGQSRFIW